MPSKAQIDALRPFAPAPAVREGGFRCDGFPICHHCVAVAQAVADEAARVAATSVKITLR